MGFLLLAVDSLFTCYSQALSNGSRVVVGGATIPKSIRIVYARSSSDSIDAYLACNCTSSGGDFGCCRCGGVGEDFPFLLWLVINHDADFFSLSFGRSLLAVFVTLFDSENCFNRSTTLEMSLVLVFLCDKYCAGEEFAGPILLVEIDVPSSVLALSSFFGSNQDSSAVLAEVTASSSTFAGALSTEAMELRILCSRRFTFRIPTADVATMTAAVVTNRICRW